MVRHAGETDGAKENRLMMAYLLEAILGHHATCLRVQSAAPVKVLPVESETEFARGRVKDANTFGHDFFANAVTGNDGDLVALHSFLLSFTMFRPSRRSYAQASSTLRTKWMPRPPI